MLAVNKAERIGNQKSHDMRHGDAEFGVCPTGFWFCFHTEVKILSKILRRGEKRSTASKILMFPPLITVTKHVKFNPNHLLTLLWKIDSIISKKVKKKSILVTWLVFS